MYYALRLKGFKKLVLIAYSTANSLPMQFPSTEKAMQFAMSQGIADCVTTYSLDTEEDFYAKTFTLEDVKDFFLEKPNFTISSFSSFYTSYNYFGTAITCPKWVKFLATAENGYIYGFPYKPTLGDREWYTADFSCMERLGLVKFGGDWKESLVEIRCT